MEATAPTETTRISAENANSDTSKTADDDGPTLTQKQSLFVSEYLKDGNSAAAARRAGYTGDNMDVIGPRLVKKPHIAAAIKNIQDVRDAETGYNLALFTENLVAMALFDPLDLHDPATGRMRSLEKIPINARLDLHLHYKIDPKDPHGKPLLASATTRDRLRALAMLIKTHTPPKPNWAQHRQQIIDDAEEAEADAKAAEHARIYAEKSARRDRENAEYRAFAKTHNHHDFPYANPGPWWPEHVRQEWMANYAKKVAAEAEAAKAAEAGMQPRTERSSSPQQTADTDRTFPDERSAGGPQSPAAPLATASGPGKVGTPPASKQDTPQSPSTPPALSPNHQKIPTNTNQPPTPPSSNPHTPSTSPAKSTNHQKIPTNTNHPPASGLESLLTALDQTDPKLQGKRTVLTFDRNGVLVPKTNRPPSR